MSLETELRVAVKMLEPRLPATVARAYKERLAKGQLTKDENPASHFCAYFLPCNPATKEVLLGHHKKSGKWISPGGHIDRGETLLETLNREIHEELGAAHFFQKRPASFLLTITHIERDPRPCETHFDVWHLMKTDGGNFNIDMAEYHEVRWLSIPDAKKLAGDAANRAAMGLLESPQQ